MRTRSMRRVAAFGMAAAVATTMTGCLAGGGDEEAGGDNEVLVWVSVDPPVVEGLQSALDAKAPDGVSIKVQRVDDINSLIMQRIQAGDVPDIALIPQPGVVKDVVARTDTVALDDVLDMDALQETMTPGTLEAGTVDGELRGLLVSMNIKSLVFYNKKAWDKAGYQAPESIDELNQLTEQIKSDGGTPWCMGIESEAATGWPATDWFEDLVMRYGGADVYNQWVAHEVPFDSDVVRQAAGEFEELMFTDGNVLGGRQSIPSTNFGTAGNPMFKAEPECWLYKQGSFITGFFQESGGVKDLDAEVGVFGFPPAEAGGDNPVLGGGDLAVMLSDDDNTAAVMNLLADPTIGEEAAPNSSFISPHTTFDASLYPNDLTRDIANVGYDSTAFLFDGSDQMPGEVGAGSFWKEMTAWIADQQDLDTTLKNI
ncbi:ABC transporter substrate-binding protein, partial [Nocardioides aestuarii]